MKQLEVITKEGTPLNKDRKANLQERIKERQSKDLVIAFCGPIASGVSSVVKHVAAILETFDYESEIIKLSDFIKENIPKTMIKISDEELKKDTAERIIKLQDAGNELRKKYSLDILSQFAIKEIGFNRQERIQKEDEALKGIIRDTPHRVAYLIDSIKHPSEINLLRIVYGNMFYLFGVLCAEPIRVKRLIEKGFSADDAQQVIERDKKQEEGHGQQLVKALQYADFFARNNHQNIEGLKNQIKRFFDLIFGTKVVTPTHDEFAMYIAQSAALRSACLSRQIGAAILNKEGEIVSTGCNDVPCYEGGLYTPEHGDKDSRCAYLQGSKCFNDDHKSKLKDKIDNILKDSTNIKEKIDSIVKNIYEDTWLKDVLEFSRAIHAEMAAIVSAARNGHTVKGCTLYTLTFPCHNCARHIVASGIKRVVYIEPYEKSRALELHGDSIELEPSMVAEETGKVIFLHFEGIAPRQYLNLFRITKERKKEGKLVLLKPQEALPVVPQYLDTFIDLEAQVAKHLESLKLI
jgi:deoxycytidylate deaminase